MFNRDRRVEKKAEPTNNRNGLNVGGNGQSSSNNQFASGSTNVEFSRENRVDERDSSCRDDRQQSNRVEFARENCVDEDVKRNQRNLNSRVEFARENNILNDSEPRTGNNPDRDQNRNLNSRVEFARENNIKNDPEPRTGDNSNRNQNRNLNNQSNQSTKDDSYYDLT